MARCCRGRCPKASVRLAVPTTRRAAGPRASPVSVLALQRVKRRFERNRGWQPLGPLDRRIRLARGHRSPKRSEALARPIQALGLGRVRVARWNASRASVKRSTSSHNSPSSSSIGRAIRAVCRRQRPSGSPDRGRAPAGGRARRALPGPPRPPRESRSRRNGPTGSETYRARAGGCSPAPAIRLAPPRTAMARAAVHPSSATRWISRSASGFAGCWKKAAMSMRNRVIDPYGPPTAGPRSRRARPSLRSPRRAHFATELPPIQS